jgi:hypothetical protein
MTQHQSNYRSILRERIKRFNNRDHTAGVLYKGGELYYERSNKIVHKGAVTASMPAIGRPGGFVTF